MAGKVKAWVWVILAIVVIGILCVVAMAGIGLYFFSQHVQTSTDLCRQRRARLRSGPEPLRRTEAADRTRSARTVSAFERGSQAARSSEAAGIHQRDGLRSGRREDRPGQHPVLAYPDEDEGRHDRPQRQSHGPRGSEALRAEDLERFGPTLIVDHQNTSASACWSGRSRSRRLSCPGRIRVSTSSRLAVREGPFFGDF